MKGFLAGGGRGEAPPPHQPHHHPNPTPTLAFLWAPSLRAFRRAKLQQSDLLQLYPGMWMEVREREKR